MKIFPYYRETSGSSVRHQIRPNHNTIPHIYLKNFTDNIIELIEFLPAYSFLRALGVLRGHDELKPERT